MLILTFLFFQQRLSKTTKEHIRESLELEFLPHYYRNDIEWLKKFIDDEHFQVLNRKGEIVIDLKSSVHYNPPLNMSNLVTAFTGSKVYITAEHQGIDYLVLYSPLDDGHIVRVVTKTEELSALPGNFIRVFVITFPGMLILAYILTRYMVNQSMKPIINILQFQETFSSNITHELNSPLTSIKGNLEVSLRRDRSLEEYKETLKSALNQVDEIIYILNNLFLLATSKFKPLDLHKENVMIATIIDETIEKYEPLAYSKNIKFNLSVQQNLYYECDGHLMKRVIENLIDNAVNYAPANDFIKISAIPGKKNNILIISNTYEGTIKGEIKDLFSPFHRGKDVTEKNIKGKGLGLYLVQYIIHSHGGTITADLDNGLISFTIKLPQSLS